MSDGKRYKKNDTKDLGQEEKKLQKQYQEMLEEIEVKKEDEIAELKKENNFKESLVAETKEVNKLIETIQKDTNNVEVIQKIKEEIIGSTEQILEKIEKESNIQNESQKLDEIREKIEELEKQALGESEEVLILTDDKSKETEKEVLFSIENQDVEKSSLDNDINTKEIKKELNKETQSIKKESKFIKIIGNIIYYIIFLFVVAILVLVAVQRFSNNEISLGGYRMFNILTESMKPDYNVGDILISKEIEAEKIQIGDDIVYKGKEKPFVDIVVTHRVVDLNEEKDGTYSFLTRGIANDIDDPIITESQVYGKIIYKVRSFSILSKAINNMYVFFFVIFIPIVILVSIKILQIKHEKTDYYTD